MLFQISHNNIHLSNIIFLPILLLSICVKVPRGRDLRKQDNGNGMIELCYLTFLSPKTRVLDTQ